MHRWSPKTEGRGRWLTRINLAVVYIKDFEGEIVMRPLDDSHQHSVINYSKSWKLVEEARQINPYAMRKDLGIDYKFWNEFHSNFYAVAILDARKTKIRKMQYINCDEMQDKEEPEFDKMIKVCDRFELSDIMGFKYHRNEEVLAQFYATYFYD
jgi:hypothetical protein